MKYFLSVLFLQFFVVHSTAAPVPPEYKLQDYLIRFPQAQGDIYSEDVVPRIDESSVGHQILTETKSRIYNQSEIPRLENNNTFLIIGSTWILFDAPFSLVANYISTVVHAQYPPPVVATRDLIKLDSERQQYIVTLKNGLLGINLAQECAALLSAHFESSQGDATYGFYDCLQTDKPENKWVHESWSRDHLVAKHIGGREVTLMLYQNFTVIERHKLGAIKPTQALLLSIAVASAKGGFDQMMKDVSQLKYLTGAGF